MMLFNSSADQTLFLVTSFGRLFLYMLVPTWASMFLLQEDVSQNARPHHGFHGDFWERLSLSMFKGGF